MIISFQVGCEALLFFAALAFVILVVEVTLAFFTVAAFLVPDALDLAGASLTSGSGSASVSMGTSASATGTGSTTTLGLGSGDVDIDDKSDNGSWLKIIRGATIVARPFIYPPNASDHVKTPHASCLVNSAQPQTHVHPLDRSRLSMFNAKNGIPTTSLQVIHFK